VPLEKTEREIYKVEDALELKEISSSRLIKEVDLIINVPKIKTHWQCTLTCCIKNMFGTVLLANKAKIHAQAAILERFSSALVDIYSVSKPQLTIIDGYYCMEGKGPSSGDVVKLDIIIAGHDGVALDATVCKIIGFEPSEVLYLEKANNKKLGTTDLERVEFLGEPLESVYHKFKRPKLRPISMPLPKWLADYIGKTVFRAKVNFNNEKCKLCSTCWTNCPVNAITPPDEIKKGNVPIWDKHKCITCFCCVELCPYEAVNFKINYIKNVMFSWMGLIVISFLALVIFIFFWIFGL
jgi:ferredoxin